MKKLIFALAALSLSWAAFAQLGGVAVGTTEDIISGWPETPRTVARIMIEKYGQPNEATRSMLIWKNNGPWKRSIVYREEVPHNFPKSHTDVLQQVVDYRYPVDRFDDLARFDGSVMAERTKGELSARCDKEEMNFLALNLAYDIAVENRTVSEAREFYAKTAMEALAGKESEYTKRLLFTIGGRTADPDWRLSPEATRMILP